MKEPKTKYIDDVKPTLKEMQEFVGGYIEVIYLNKKSMMVIDEEGKIKDKPINYEATEIAHGNEAIFNTDYISGDAMVLSGNARLS
jgi:hypothetical protein